MRRGSSQPVPPGPSRADQLGSGDPHELSHVHPIRRRRLPTGGRSRSLQAASIGAKVLASDPAVREVGLDTEFSPARAIFRAPDLAVGGVPGQPGSMQAIPPLAVAYVETGRDEGELAAEIQALLAAGTRLIWVVRLNGPCRVEVYRPGRAMCIARPGEELRAPGILVNPVPVEALYDRQGEKGATLRNLLKR